MLEQEELIAASRRDYDTVQGEMQRIQVGPMSSAVSICMYMHVYVAGLLQFLEILECTWIFQWQVLGLESTWKVQSCKTMEKIKRFDETLSAEYYPLSHVISSVRQAFLSEI